MLLNFNLENIEYLKMELDEQGVKNTYKLALKQKNENNFIAVMPIDKELSIEAPCSITLSFVCADGLYKTNTILEKFYKDDFYCLEIKNPDSLDYQQNRNYYRVLANFDCIYTVETDDGVESFNANTYDISAGGVSIITSENIIPTRETSIVIFMPERDLKTHLQFVRCEAYEDDYKLSFTFTDLSERDFNMLSELCVNKQISQF
ncbi:PilZ domain-containing protein [bacterium]|nr:PilZ domain-containing protein [bacterium]